MPTGPRLFAALGTALMMFFASEIYKTYLPEGIAVGLLSPVNALIAFLCGWNHLGRRVGRGYGAAAGFGLSAMALALFYILLTWSLYEMLRRSLRKLYDGPVEALKAMAELMGKYAVQMGTDFQVPAVIVLGGILAAVLAEWVHRHVTATRAVSTLR